MIGYVLLGISAVLGYFYGRKKDWQYAKYLRIVAIIAGLCFIVGSIEELRGNQVPLEQLPRNAVGKGRKDLPLFLEIEGGSKQEYIISVEEQQLTEEEATELFTQAKQELENMILGE